LEKETSLEKQSGRQPSWRETASGSAWQRENESVWEVSETAWPRANEKSSDEGSESETCFENDEGSEIQSGHVQRRSPCSR